MKRGLRGHFHGWLAALALLASVAALRAELFGDIDVSAQIFFKGNTQQGYVEHRLVVANRSANRTHQVTLILPGGAYDINGPHLSRLSRTVTVGPNASVVVPLWQPALEMGGDESARVLVDGRLRGRLATASSGRHPTSFSSKYNSDGVTRLLFSRNINSDNLNRLLKSTTTPKAASTGHRGGSTSSGTALELMRAELEPTQWSEYWLSYTSADAVLLSQSDFSLMSEPVRTALWRYTESGGCLVVLGRIDVPETWRGREVPSTDGATHHRIGFGECLQLDASSVETLTPPQLVKLKSVILQTSVSMADKSLLNQGQSLNSFFPVVDNANLPVRGMTFLMLVFILVVGPINLLVLRAMKRPIWFLWTIPVISAVTCLFVVVYSLFSEGITPSTRTKAVTLLDQSARRATTAALLAFYCPLTPGDGLRFAAETEVTPLLSNDRETSGSREMDWSNGQHLTLGWLSARVPTHFITRKSETRRERLQVERAASGELTVVNGLGAQVKQLWLADAQGRLHKTGIIAAGDKSTLTNSGESTGSGPMPNLSKFVTDPITEISNRSFESLKLWLRPGVYFAELEGAPFTEKALAGKVKSNASSLVIGLLEPEALR